LSRHPRRAAATGPPLGASASTRHRGRNPHSPSRSLRITESTAHCVERRLTHDASELCYEGIDLPTNLILDVVHAMFGSHDRSASVKHEMNKSWSFHVSHSASLPGLCCSALLGARRVFGQNRDRRARAKREPGGSGRLQDATTLWFRNSGHLSRGPRVRVASRPRLSGASSDKRGTSCRFSRPSTGCPD
jgi:hypothetical protein